MHRLVVNGVVLHIVCADTKSGAVFDNEDKETPSADFSLHACHPAFLRNVFIFQCLHSTFLCFRRTVFVVAVLDEPLVGVLLRYRRGALQSFRASRRDCFLEYRPVNRQPRQNKADGRNISCTVLGGDIQRDTVTYACVI